MAPRETDPALKLLRRVLEDPDYRARLRRDPDAALREEGVESENLAADKPMETLDIRESRSSLAGAFMAAAAEGVSVLDLAHHDLGGGGGGAGMRPAAAAVRGDARRPTPAATPVEPQAPTTQPPPPAAAHAGPTSAPPLQPQAAAPAERPAQHQ